MEYLAIPVSSHFVEMKPMSRDEIKEIKDQIQLRKDHERMKQFAAALAALR